MGLGSVLADAASGYWNRQGEMARGSLDLANRGAENIQAGNVPEGIAEMLLGPLGYLASPLSALVPYEQADNPAIPEDARPAARGIMEALGNFVPGPDLPVGAMLGGIASKNTKALQKLPEYTQRLATGASTDRLHSETGWFTDKDLQPKYEFSDQGTGFYPHVEDAIKALQNSDDWGTAYTIPLKDAIKHPEYFDSFPDLANVPTRFTKGLMGASGHFMAPDAILSPESKITGILPGEIALAVGHTGFPTTMPSLADIHSTGLHEMSHAISAYHDNWARGGNPGYFETQIKERYPLIANLAEDAKKAWNQVFETLSAQKLAVKVGTPQWNAYWRVRQAVNELRYPIGRPSEQTLRSLKQDLPVLPNEVQQAILPELQKALTSTKEVFATPYLPEEAYGLYSNLLDETNARAIQSRRNLSIDERFANPFYYDRTLQPDALLPSVDIKKPLAKNQQARALPRYGSQHLYEWERRQPQK